ncbi:MAG TPA: hypothetical protein VGD52_24830 [Pseudoduganella sp.]
MIIPHPGMSNVWYRCAVLWFAALTVIGIDCTIIDSHRRLDNFDIRIFIAIWLAVPIVLWAVGRIFGDCSRVITYTVIFGLLGALPSIVMVSISSSLFLFIAKPHLLTLSFLACATLIVTVIAIIKFLSFRKALKVEKFVEREFRISSSVVQVDRGVERNGGDAGSRLRQGFLTLVPSLAATVYILQAGLVKYMGDAALVLVLSLLTTPIAVHAISQFIGGFYLWIYLTWKLERRHKLEVRFIDPADEG